MMTDPIADMLTRIRNAQMARKSFITLPFSKMKLQILEILRNEGYIATVEAEDGKTLRADLKYEGRQPAIRSLVRESTPGHRRYCKAEEMPKVLNNYGFAIISTSQGIMTNSEARKLGIGGEVICSVY